MDSSSQTTPPRLFRPSPQAVNGLLVIGFVSVGYALYLRYFAIEQSAVGLACQSGADTWLCTIRQIVTSLFRNSAFGIAALLVAALNIVRPSLVLFAVAIALAGFGVVLYNTNLSALAVALLILSLARRAPEPE